MLKRSRNLTQVVCTLIALCAPTATLRSQTAAPTVPTATNWEPTTWLKMTQRANALLDSLALSTEQREALRRPNAKARALSAQARNDFVFKGGSWSTVLEFEKQRRADAALVLSDSQRVLFQRRLPAVDETPATARP